MNWWLCITLTDSSTLLEFATFGHVVCQALAVRLSGAGLL